MAPRRQSSTQDTTQSTQDVEVHGTETAEVVAPEVFNDADYRAIDTFKDAMLAANTITGIIDASTTIGDGFTLVQGDDGKRDLIGKPLMVMEWSFRDGDYGDREYVTMRIITPIDPDDTSKGVRKLIINDGSSGLCKTLRDITDNMGRKAGLLVKHGLRESTYDYCQDCKKAVNARKHDTSHDVGPGATFYFDTSN